MCLEYVIEFALSNYSRKIVHHTVVGRELEKFLDWMPQDNIVEQTHLNCLCCLKEMVNI